MTDIISMNYCSCCKTNRSSTLFAHPSRAVPYKAFSDCRTRKRSRRHPPLFQVRPAVAGTSLNNIPDTGTFASNDVNANETREHVGIERQHVEVAILLLTML